MAMNRRSILGLALALPADAAAAVKARAEDGPKTTAAIDSRCPKAAFPLPTQPRHSASLFVSTI